MKVNKLANTGLKGLIEVISHQLNQLINSNDHIMMWNAKLIMLCLFQWTVMTLHLQLCG